jgi:hypothetical protein
MCSMATFVASAVQPNRACSAPTSLQIATLTSTRAEQHADCGLNPGARTAAPRLLSERRLGEPRPDGNHADHREGLTEFPQHTRRVVQSVQVSGTVFTELRPDDVDRRALRYVFVGRIAANDVHDLHLPAAHDASRTPSEARVRGG